VPHVHLRSGAELERIKGGAHSTVAALFYTVSHCFIKDFGISVGAATPMSYNVASLLPKIDLVDLHSLHSYFKYPTTDRRQKSCLLLSKMIDDMV
jgi:hypothetical protein